MLAIQKNKTHKGNCTPNVLPCRVNHSGPVNASSRYWDPKSADGTTTSYFRGRKLHAKRVKLPEGYRGVVVSKTERVLPREPAEDEDVDGDDGEEEEEVKIMEEQAGFGEVMVWGHEVVPEDMVDPYVRGVEEWIGFAEQIHSYDEDEGKGGDGK